MRSDGDRYPVRGGAAWIVRRNAGAVVIIGGGPGGYEAALVAAQLGAEVTVVDRDGLGGSAVLTDCVPSKTLIATAEVMTAVVESGELGRPVRAVPSRARRRRASAVASTWRPSTRRVKALAAAQSADIAASARRERVRGRSRGTGRLDGPERVVVERPTAPTQRLDADVVLVATGARRGCCRAPARRRAHPDLEAGLRPGRAAGAADRGRVRRDRRRVRQRVQRARLRRRAGLAAATGCCPARTPTPPQVLEDVFRRRGMTVLSRSRARAGGARRRRRASSR